MRVVDPLPVTELADVDPLVPVSLLVLAEVSTPGCAVAARVTTQHFLRLLLWATVLGALYFTAGSWRALIEIIFCKFFVNR